MPAVFTDADGVRQMAEDLIKRYHQRIIDHRVRVVYLFSDREPQTHGKRVFGEVKIIQNLPAYLAEKAEVDYELPTFVCLKCKAWKTDGELAELEVNGDIYSFCGSCHDVIADWNWDTVDNRAQVEGWREMAKQKYDGGFDPSATNSFFVVVVYKTYWDFFSENTRRGSVNHLLCHLGVSKDRHGDTKLFKAPHDIEDFNANVEVFGTAWMPDLDRFADIAIRHKSPQLLLITDDNGHTDIADALTARAGGEQPVFSGEPDNDPPPTGAPARKRKAKDDQPGEESVPLAAAA